MDIGLPIWRVGEALLYASRVARSFGDNPEISIQCRFTGLSNRRLGSIDGSRPFLRHENRVRNDDRVEMSARAAAVELDDNLVAIVHPLLAPLYERFAFFELPIDLVRVEIGRMRSNRL